jgi:hypothetical protein
MEIASAHEKSTVSVCFGIIYNHHFEPMSYLFYFSVLNKIAYDISSIEIMCSRFYGQAVEHNLMFLNLKFSLI